ncbi:HNH endonuclease [Corynebacterium pseudopelargi]|uniref:HNH endonuclease n=2 Tax=Corynebacterium pseudopelargi TaxID=2080757 RepID=A0A3G6IS46_9CORY|nr:HNH endonuclease [Corynebacterium pseudopelargi]
MQEEANYKICDFDDELAQQGAFIRRYEYLMWEQATPEVAGTNWEWEARDVGASLGMSDQAVLNRFLAVYTLQHMPKLMAVFRRYWHLDMRRILAISSALNFVEDAESYDEALADFLTPRVENEDIPSPRKIRAFIAGLVEVPTPVEEEEDQIWTRSNGDGRVAIGVITSSGTAELIRQTLREKSASSEQPLGEIFLALIGGKVTINIYENTAGQLCRASGARFSHVEATWLREHAARRLLQRDEATNAYRFSPKMRAYIAGRDGHCRYPGCQVPEYACDIDHVVEFDRGGKTTPANAQMLCRRHHNLKTSKQVHCSIDEHAAVTWELGKHSVTTLPGGPIPP